MRCLLDLSIVSLIAIVLHIRSVAALCSLLHVEVNLEVAALKVSQLFTVHLEEGCLGALVLAEDHIGEALGLLGRPVASHAHLLDLAEGAEAVADVVLLKGIWQVLHE